MVWLEPNLIIALRQAWLKAHRGSQGLDASLQVKKFQLIYGINPKGDWGC